MKTCPTCKRTYDDEALIFCLHDGSPLTGDSISTQETQRINVPQDTGRYGSAAPPPVYDSPPTVTQPPPQYGAWAQPPQKSGSGKLWLAIAGIAALLLLAAGVGAGIFLSRGDLLSGDNSKSESNNNDKGESRGSNTSSTPSSTPKPTPTPTPEVPVAERLGMVGKWSGSQNSGPISLTLVAGEGNAFSGTKVQREYQISFVGTIDENTRRITINETKLLKGTPYSNGKGWSLGKETGKLSADGKRMSGTGTDQYTRKTPYSWSYRKK